MPLRGKVVVTCAVTGAIHTPTMSPYLLLTPDEIAKDAVAAAEAGAAILHLHARDPKDGRPTPDPDVFMQFLPRIKQATNAVVNITTGGGLGMTLEARLAAPCRAKPENLAHMKRIADKLFGDDYAWSILAAGRHQLPLITMGAIMGGSVRVGLEDSLWLGRGQLAQGNAGQVSRIRTILENLSLEIASPDEARQLLALKGGDDVAF